MKKVILVIMILIMLFTIGACTNEQSNNLIATYDFENRQCDITNISKTKDYEKLNVTVVLNGKDNFSKEIKFEIGDLDSGETYKGDLSYISEEKEVANVYVKSYEYYENYIGSIIIGIIIAALIVFGLIMIDDL